MYVRKRVIRSMVERLIEQHRLHSLPVPIERLAKNLHLEIHRDAVEDKICGFLYRAHEGEPAIIGVNSRHPRTRQRFTIAHELGHFFLHAGDPVFVDESLVLLRDQTSGDGEKLLEVEANLFAAELLMPVKSVLEQIERLAPEDISEDDKIERLAETFGVSVQAMSFRLANLGVAFA